MNRYAKVKTSQLLGLAAARVEGDDSPIGIALAAELRERAMLIDDAATTARRSCDVVHCDSCEALRAIGEVHS